MIDGRGTSKMAATKDFDSPDCSEPSESARMTLALPTLQEHTSEASHLQGNKRLPSGETPHLHS